MLWVRISIRARCTTLCDKVCQWLATDRWFSPGPLVSSTNKSEHHDITEILLKAALNTCTIKQTNKHIPHDIGFLAPAFLNYLAIQSFDYELTRWKLFRKRVARTKSSLHSFIKYAMHTASLHGELNISQWKRCCQNITSEIWFLGVWRHFQQYFSYIMATSFSGGRSRREPPTMGKQLVNFITCGCESNAPFL